MSADALPLDPEVFTEGLSDRVLRQFKVAAQDWFDVCRRLSEWEDRRLVDDPSPEALAQHAKVLGNLEWLGRILAMLTQNREFPDRQLAELVASTLQDLQDRRALWHGKMTSAERDRVLHEIFPHES